MQKEAETKERSIFDLPIFTEEFLNHSKGIMKRSAMKKKASGAEGRKERRLEAEEAKKSSKFFTTFFVKPGESSQSCPTEPPTTAASSLETSETEEEVQSEAIQSETATAEVDTTGGEDSDGDHEREPDETEPSELGCAMEPQIAIPEVLEKHDIGFLKFNKDSRKAIVTDKRRTEIVQWGFTYFRNSEGPFLPTKNRSMSKSWFWRKLGDGHGGREVLHSWLVYSPSKRSAFCFCCLLFSQSDPQSSLEQESGFSQWKHSDRIPAHENASRHRECFRRWKERERTVAANRGVIDRELQAQIETDRQRWRDILTRILHCIKYLVTQNLGLQGHRETLELDALYNAGNFLGLLKLLAVFDPVIKEHLCYVESHRGTASYLSHSIQDEFIHMMAYSVHQSLLTDIRKAKYYGLLFDTTPDLAHREQMSEVVRYVDVDFQKKTVRVKEAFLGFILISQKDAESLDLKGLRDLFLNEREVLVSESLERGFALCEEWDVEIERHVRCRKTMAGEKCRDAGLTAKQEIERIMKGALDRLHRELDEIFTRLHNTDTKFGFLLDTNGLCYSDEKVNLKNNCETFTQFYSCDVDGEQLYEEIMDCRMLLSQRDDVRILKPDQFLEFIVAYGDESVFPNLRTVVQILLTIAVSIASCERSFSKLKLILSCLRASMGQQRLLLF
ncbi:hypothetical protein lerEdw1_012055 [Lerista edwardsae]|nr:hypothetical protein lerEdw1_012055 [Lerista edwardsae]